MSETTHQAVFEAAEAIWRRCDPLDLRRRLEEECRQLGAAEGCRYEPLYPLATPEKPLSCAVLGSGGFTTGRWEIERAREVGKRIGWTPLEHVAVVTDRKATGAAETARDLAVPLVEIDYPSWRKTAGVTSSTRLFGFSGPGPDRTELGRRLEVRRRFDRELRRRLDQTSARSPDTLSLRGYDFVVTDLLVDPETIIDNTHPASLTVREPDGRPAYAGWQASATERMARDGHARIPASLVRVLPVQDVDGLTRVDGGELLAVSPGRPEGYSKEEDRWVIALKASGLLGAFWMCSRESGPVAFERRGGGTVEVHERRIAVAGARRSGREAFGSRPGDLADLVRWAVDG